MNRIFLSVAAALGIVLFSQGCTLEDIVAVVVGSVEVQPDSLTILQGGAQQLTAQVLDDSGAELPTTGLTWSSDDPSVFWIDPLTGEGEARGPGQATIWASHSGVRGSGTVLVEPAPSIVVSDSSLAFLGRVGGAQPDPIDLAVTNGGAGSVTGLSASVGYPAGAPTGWVSLALHGTTAPSTLTVSVILGSLGEGVYHATVVLASPNATNSPVSIAVEAVVVFDTPVIGLSPEALGFLMEAGAAPPDAQTVEVTNQGGGTLSDLQAQPFYPGVGGWLSATLSEATAPTDLLVELIDPGLPPGTYQAEVRVTGPGALNTPQTLDVTLTVDPGPVVAAQSTAEVPAGVAGSATTVSVQARNTSGYPMPSGGALVVVTVSGANEAGPITATDWGDGTYSASYTPTSVGTDDVAITLDGSPLGGSPFSSAVSVGGVSPAHSTASVPGGTAGLPTEIVVQARDAQGNPLSSGGATVMVTVSGANAAGPIAATDVGDGTYSASYTPTVAGSDAVAITLNEAPLGASPFGSPVGPGIVSPGHSTAAVPAGQAGAPTDIVVHARDQYGNALSSGGAAVVVTVLGSDGTKPIEAVDVGDGTYAASYVPTQAGTDEIAITLDGAPLGESPFSSVVSAGTASPEHSTAEVPDGRRRLVTNIVVQARDAYGNPLSVGGQTVVVTIVGRNPTGPSPAIDLGDGTYTWSYTPPRTGSDYVTITMDGVELAGSPFRSRVRR